MSKQMQSIVLFIEPSDDAFDTPEKIGHLFMNRFAVDENASFEVLNVLELGKTTRKMTWFENPEYENGRKEKGMGLGNMVSKGKDYIFIFEGDQVKLH